MGASISFAGIRGGGNTPLSCFPLGLSPLMNRDSNILMSEVTHDPTPISSCEPSKRGPRYHVIESDLWSDLWFRHNKLFQERKGDEKSKY